MTNQPSDDTTPPKTAPKKATPTRRTTKTPTKKGTARPKGATASRARNKQRTRKPGSTTGTPPRVMAGVLDRRTKAYEMWLMGTDYVTIGRALGKSKGVPEGYNDVDRSGYPVEDRSLAEVVRVDLARVRDERGRHLDETVQQHRQALIDRHYRMIAALGPAVMRGDPAAHGAAIKHLERIAKLSGADSAIRVEVGAEDPEVAAAVQSIMDAITAAAPAPAPGEAATEPVTPEGGAPGGPSA